MEPRFCDKHNTVMLGQDVICAACEARAEALEEAVKVIDDGQFDNFAELIDLIRALKVRP